MDMNISLELAQSTIAIHNGGKHGSHETATPDRTIRRNSALDPFEPLGSTGTIKRDLPNQNDAQA